MPRPCWQMAIRSRRRRFRSRSRSLRRRRSFPPARNDDGRGRHGLSFRRRSAMVTLAALWLPILVSAVIVFIVSNVLWMALPFWHRRDHGKLPDEKTVLDALVPAKSGQYIVPCLNWNTITAEERAAMHTRPMAFVLVRNPAKFNFAVGLAQYFLYTIVVAVFVAYVTGRARGAGTPRSEERRVGKEC